MKNREKIINHLEKCGLDRMTLLTYCDRELCRLFARNMEQFETYEFCQAYITNYSYICPIEDRCEECLMKWIKEN